MIRADPEYYRSLRKELTIQGRWFNTSAIGLSICLGVAFQAGVSAGWPWLLGAILTLFTALWARIDQQTTQVLLQVYLANTKDA